MAAEIQETSDITYRIYDFDRRDSEGKLRELHNEQAIQVIDFSASENEKVSYIDNRNAPVGLVECDYFITNKLELDTSVQRTIDDTTFVIYICLDGKAEIANKTLLSQGEVVLIPAAIASGLPESVPAW